VSTHKIMAEQAGTDRIVGRYKPIKRNIIVSSHWENKDEMLKSAEECYGGIEWYQIGKGEKVIVK